MTKHSKNDYDFSCHGLQTTNHDHEKPEIILTTMST